MNKNPVITRRQLSREPATLDAIKPGQTVSVPDAFGGLLVSRPKRHPLTPAEMLAQLDGLPGTWPEVDADLLEGET